MSFGMVPNNALFSLLFMHFWHRSPALVDDVNATKDQNHGHDFQPSHLVQTDGDADDGGNGGLHIVVHADQRRTDAFLPDGDKEIGNESGKNHHEGHLPKHLALHLPKRHADKVFRVERQGHQHGKQEHPLHEGHHVVFRNQRTENAEIQGKRERIDDGQHDAHRLGLRRAATETHRVENQNQDTGKAHKDAADFLARDGFFQDDGSHNHGQDGRAGVGDAQVDGGRHRDGFQEADLGEVKPQHGSHENLGQVFRVHLFLGHEERHEPKQDGGTRRPQAKQIHWAQHTCVGDVLAADDVEPKNAVGTKTSEVPDKR